MHSIPLNKVVRQQLEAVLKSCGPFKNYDDLQALFVDRRIHLWRSELPRANTLAGQVSQTIAFLWEQYNSADENGLVLFLHVLADGINPNDRRYHQLYDLIDQLVLAVSPSDDFNDHKLPLRFTVNPPAVPRPINLSFDGPTSFGIPNGWFNSRGFVGNVSIDYKIEVVCHPDSRNGACVLFQNPQATEGEFGSLMQRCFAQSLAGKLVRVEGEVKTSKVENWAGLWLRADGEEIPDLLFDNMSKYPIRGSTPWKNYKIEAQLPKGTVWLNYGIVLAGRGQIWVDNFRLMVWGEGEWLDI